MPLGPLLRFRTVAVLAAICLASLTQIALAAEWKAGVAKVKITPEVPMWMSGYASRDHVAEGTLHDLWTKALVLEDAQGKRVVLVTLDLVGIGRDVADDVTSRLRDQYKLERDQVAICCSHTHTGPVVGHNLGSMYFLDPRQQQLVIDYTNTLRDKMVEVVEQALADVKPAKVGWGIGQATFAVNRRNNPEPEVPQLRESGQLRGPVDHEVPVLAVSDEGGKLRAIACGYACHATVLSFYQWTGDYPGFAQIQLEQAHPGAVALFWAGCGGDQNPLPRRTVELAEEYGKQLAAAVDRVLEDKLTPLNGTIATSYELVDAPFDKLPTMEDLTRDTESSDRYVAQRAKILLEQIKAGTPLSPTYAYPVEIWRLGPELLWVFLGGEVVVDYSVRLKQELGPGKTWIAGYSNDVMAYIPSRRVWADGGYEGGGAMVYYGQPTRWAPEIEEVIVRQVHQQAEKAPASEAN